MKIYVHNNLPCNLVAESHGEWFILGGCFPTMWRDRTPIRKPFDVQISESIIHTASYLRIHSDVPFEE